MVYVKLNELHSVTLLCMTTRCCPAGLSQLSSWTMRGSSILSLPLLFLFLASVCTSAAALKPAQHGHLTGSFKQSMHSAARLHPRLQSDGFETRWYTQTLDHFNYLPESYATFQQRYDINFNYWGGAKNNSPIFFFPGLEAPLADGDHNNLVVEHAAHFKALIVYMEHRYYGESLPFGSREEALRNSSTLGYLSSAQALADYAQFLVDLKKNLSAENSPIIAIGCSYGGMLASWFRLKYPHIVMGAYASSAPILDIDDITHEDEYGKRVTKDFQETSWSCYETIRRSWSEIDKVASKKDGLSILSKTFNTCSRLNDSQQLKDFLTQSYSDFAQFGDPPNNPIYIVCKGIDEAPQGTSDLGRISAGFRALNLGPCLDLSPPPDDNTSIPWGWQCCTEIISPLGTVDNETLFEITPPIDFENFTKDCQDSLGATPRPLWITTEFGGHRIMQVLEKFGSNIIFTNGLQDPFSSGGVLENISDSIVAITTAHGSHCLDLGISLPDDPDWLIEQRKQVIGVMEGWLAEYYASTTWEGGGTVSSSTTKGGFLGWFGISLLMGCIWALFY